MKRRDFLAALVATPPILALETSPLFAQISPRSDILNVSEVLTGRSPLAPSVAIRIESLLSKRDSSFPEKLARLTKAVGTARPNEQEKIIVDLNEEDAQTAIKIVSAWYLGYIGTPSETHMEDDAEFITFLSAQMYEVTADNTIRPSYAQEGRDYWAHTPHGVLAPPMDPNIHEWGERSPTAAKTYAKPDPAYILLVQGKAKNIKEAKELLEREPRAHETAPPKPKPLKNNTASPANTASEPELPKQPQPTPQVQPQSQAQPQVPPKEPPAPPVNDENTQQSSTPVPPTEEPTTKPEDTNKLDWNFKNLGGPF